MYILSTSEQIPKKQPRLATHRVLLVIAKTCTPLKLKVHNRHLPSPFEDESVNVDEIKGVLVMLPCSPPLCCSQWPGFLCGIPEAKSPDLPDGTADWQKQFNSETEFKVPTAITSMAV